MAWVESLQKAIDYMEAHLLEPITNRRHCEAGTCLRLSFSTAFYNLD
jgi:hypothetical protein